MRFTIVLSLLLLLTATMDTRPEDHGSGKAAVCAGCHGGNGISPQPSRPHLAGQDPEYLVRQLQAFKTGSRRNAIMNGVAAGLSEADIMDLAAYFADLSPPPGNGENSTLTKQGRILYQACWGCHGPRGEGQEGYPRLAGQHAAYLVRQLENFRTGRRNNPVMAEIARTLDGNEARALGAYLESLGGTGGWHGSDDVREEGTPPPEGGGAVTERRGRLRSLSAPGSAA